MHPISVFGKKIKVKELKLTPNTGMQASPLLAKAQNWEASMGGKNYKPNTENGETYNENTLQHEQDQY